MSNFSDIGAAAAAGELAAASAVGVSVSFSHRGATAVNLYTRPTFRTDMKWDGDSLVEIRVMELLVATGQTGFSAATGEQEPVGLGDEVTYLGRHYFVQAPIEPNAYGTVFKFPCEERKTISVGVK